MMSSAAWRKELRSSASALSPWCQRASAAAMDILGGAGIVSYRQGESS